MLSKADKTYQGIINSTSMTSLSRVYKSKDTSVSSKTCETILPNKQVSIKN